MQDFSVEGVHQMFGESDFRISERNLLLSKALKFRVIFQKYALKLIESFRKMIFFRKFFNFGRDYGKTKE